MGSHNCGKVSPQVLDSRQELLVVIAIIGDIIPILIREKIHEEIDRYNVIIN